MGTILLMGAGLQTTVTGPTYDPDAQAFFNAETSAGVTLTTTQKNAVNQLVVNLKAANIWTKMKAVYPIVGGTATAHKFNLKNPADTNAAFRLVFNGGWTHSANGALPNGTNAYADTYCPINTIGNLNSIHFSYYSRTSLSFQYALMGNNTNNHLYVRNGFLRLNYNGSVTTVSDTVTQGFYIATRTASNVSKYIKNSSILGTFSVVANQTSTVNVFLAAMSDSVNAPTGYVPAECAFASMGDGLTDSEALAYYNAVNTFNTTLGRQV